MSAAASPAFVVRGEDTLVLFVADLAVSRAFYGTTLQMELVNEDDSSSVYRTDHGVVLLLSLPAARELLGDDAVAEGPRGASSVIVASVENVDATYAALRERGVTFVRPPEDRWWGLRTAHFVDPDGHVWEIHHPLAG